MKREVDRLWRQSFDLLVVGGGIYGAWVAYDAALRGLRVGLVERNDWGAGTSSASSKLIHGGLRYLEQGRLGLVRKSLIERGRLSGLGQHRVRPLQFALPVYKGDRVGRLRIRAGLSLYDSLARHRQPVAAFESLARAAFAEKYDFLSATGLVGGFTYGDCLTDDARLTLEIVDGALTAGAVAANHVRAIRLVQDGARVTGARLQDLTTGRSFEAAADMTMICAGAWSSGLLNTAQYDGAAPGMRLSKGVHLVMPRLPTNDAVLVSGDPDRRVVFMIPWYGRTLLGTTDSDYDQSPDDVRVLPVETRYLLDRANRVLADPGWSEQDVIGRFAGLRVLPDTAEENPSRVSREWAMHEPLQRLLVMVGGKLSSARADAAVAVDRVLEALGRPAQPSPTTSRRLPWAPDNGFRGWNRGMLARGLTLGLDEETAECTIQRHGTRVARLFDTIEKLPKLKQRIHPELPFCVAEIVHAVSDEMALSLDDVLSRRIPLTVLARPCADIVRQSAAIVGRLLDWSEARRDEESARLLGGNGPPKVHETA